MPPLRALHLSLSLSRARVRSLARRPRSLYRAGVGDSVDGSSTYNDAIAREEGRRGASGRCALALLARLFTGSADGSGSTSREMLSLSLSLSFTSADVTTLPRRKKHLASREARIHAAVTQLSRGPPCPTSSGVHCHVPLPPPLLPALPQLYVCLPPSPDCSLRSCSLSARDPSTFSVPSLSLSFPPSNLRWPRNEQRVHMYARARDKAALYIHTHTHI